MKQKPHGLFSSDTFAPELAAYYRDRRLVTRNAALILLLGLGWSVCFSVVGPLMQLRMNAAGLNEGALGLLNSVNSWAISILVMYFSWKSDHTVSRFGRRIPYLFISSPFIILTVVLFPFFADKWILIGLMIVQLFFMDMKNSTCSILYIDCIPRAILARVCSLMGVVLSGVGFLAMRYGMKLADISEKMPYLLTGVILIITSLTGGFLIREPPIRTPTTESFKPWSAIKIGWRDRRAIVLMLGVGAIQSFWIMYSTWIWLYAKNVLGLTRAESGAAISWSVLAGVVVAYPAGWAIDRLGSYPVLATYWVLSMVTCIMSLNMSTIHGLTAVTLMCSILGPMYGAADIMVYKSSHPAEIGSVTSTNAFLRNLYTGCLVFVSGFLIEKSGHNYKLAFILGMVMSTVGFGLFFVYRHLMRKDAVDLATQPSCPPGIVENAAG